MSRVAQAAIDAALENEQPRRRRLSGMHAVAAGAVLATAARFAAKKAPALLPSAPSLSDLAGSMRDRLADSGWIADEDPDEPQDILDEEWDEPDEDEDGDEGDEEEDEEEPPEDEAPEDEAPEDEAPEDEAPEDEALEDEEDDEESPEDEGDDDWEDDDGEDDADDDGPQASDDEDWEDEEEEADEEEPEEDEPAPAIELGSNGDGGEGASSGVPDLMRALSSRSRPPVMRRRRENEVDPAGQPPKRPRKTKS